MMNITGMSGEGYTDVHFPFCIEQGDYFFVYQDTSGDGWGGSTRPAFLYITVANLRVFRGGLPYQRGNTLKFGTELFHFSPLSTSLSQWKYTDAPQTSNDWTQTSFSDNGWSTAVAGSFPTFTSTTRYYRFTGTLANRATIPTIYTSLQNTYGFVEYVHGSEVYRYQMPSGSVSSSTPATLSNGTYYVAASINKFVLPESGNFVVAFEVHLTSGASQVADPFACFIDVGPTGSEGDYGYNRFFEGTASSVPEGNSSSTTAEKVFDEATGTRYYTTQSSSPKITYQYSNGRAEWLNYYMIRPEDSGYQYPTSWNIRGSNDGVTWDLLDVQTDIDFTPGVPQYFSLRINPKSYNQYQLDISSCNINGRCALTLFVGYTGIFATELSGLSYENPSVVAYANIDRISMSPAVNGFNNFQVTPDLPAGLSISSTTGLISGIPTIAITQNYTVSATNFLTQEVKTTQITLDIQVCGPPSRSLVRFMKISQSWANEESYTIIDAEGTTYNSPPFFNGQTQYMLYCFPVGTISVHLADTPNDGWESGARLNIQMSDGQNGYYTISSIYHRKNANNDFTYDVTYKVYPQSTLWSYSTTLVSNWYGVNAVSGFNTFDASNPPSSNGKNMWFFRTTVSLTTADFVGFILRVKARAGYVVYINGVEYFRKNLPAGDLSSSTVPTGGETETTYRYITGPNSVLVFGSNVIAIGIVNLANNNPSTILFDATLQQQKSNEMGALFDVVAAAEPAGSGINNIIDLKSTNYWKAEHPNKADFVITYTYGSHRAEFFNKHCIISSTLTEAYDPSDWAIYGSNDGETFEPVGSVTNAYFSERSTTRCFFLPNNRKPFNTYKMVITETAIPTSAPYAVAMAELSFSMVDLDQLVVPPFALDSTSYTGYVGVPFPEVTASSDLFSDFTISPALQLPLELDTSTGSIRGIPNVLMPPTQYTISAKTPKGETVSTQVLLSVENCLYPNNQFIVLIKSGSAGSEMGFTLKDSNGATLLSKSKFTNYQTSYYPQCRPTGTYTLSLTDSGHDGWDTGYFRVLLVDDSLVLYGSLGDNESTKDFSFYIGYLVTPKYASYQYLNNGAAAPTDWTQPQSSATSTWKEAKPGEFGNFAGTTAYFRKTFTVENLDSYASLAFTVKTAYGVIVYINGEKVYSYNMPDGTITYSTACFIKHYQTMNVGSSIAVQYSNLVIGANVVCFEVHVFDSTATNEIDFDSTIQFTSDGSFRLLDGEPSSDLPNDEEISKLFDNVKGTVYISGPRCVGAAPTWTYNNDRREFISSYTVITGPRCNSRTPSAWRFEGSNDGIHWSLLHEATNQYFTEYSVERTFDFYNSKVYNMYRLQASECSNTDPVESSADCSVEGGNGFQLAELSMYSKRLQAACEPTEDGYGGAVEGDYAYKDCEEYYQGKYQALCSEGQLIKIENNCYPMAIYGIEYDSEYLTIQQKTDFSFTPVVRGAEYSCFITPELPAGVSFDSETARIYGRYDEIAMFNYTVTCTNREGSYSSDIHLNFIEKTGLDTWVWIVIVVVVVILVVVLIIALVVSMSSSKKSKKNHKLEKSTAKKPAKVASDKPVKI